MANVYQSRTKCNKDSTVLIVTHSGMLRRRTCHCNLLISHPPTRPKKKKVFFFILQTPVLLCLDKNKDVFFFRLPHILNIQSQNMFLPSVQVWCYFIHDPVTLPPPSAPYRERRAAGCGSQGLLCTLMAWAAYSAYSQRGDSSTSGVCWGWARDVKACICE